MMTSGRVANIFVNIFNNKKYILISLLVIYMFLSRFLYLNSIPGFLWDEGGWTIGAKNFVLFGNPAFGNTYFHYTTPFYHFMVTIVFSLFGSSIVNARILSCLISIFILVLLFLIVKRLYNKTIAVISILLLAFNGIMTISNRTAMLETPQIFLMLLTAYFWLKEKPGFRILSGISFVCAVLLKANSIYFAVPFFLLAASAEENFSIKKFGLWFDKYKVFLFTCVILLICSVILILCFGREHFIVNWKNIINFHYKTAKTATFFQAFGYSLTRFFHAFKYFLVRMPFMILLTLVAIVNSVKNFLRKDAFILGWLAAGFLMYVFLKYQPYWYYFTLIPAACVIVSCFIYRTCLAEIHTRTRKIIGSLVIALICLFQISGTFGYYFFLGKRDDSPAKVSRYINENILPDEVIMTPHYIGVNVRNHTVGPSHSERRDIKEYNVSYIVVNMNDSAMMKINNDREFLTDSCYQITQINGIKLYKVIRQ